MNVTTAASSTTIPQNRSRRHLRSAVGFGGDTDPASATAQRAAAART